jgi:hypothetical protein
VHPVDQVGGEKLSDGAHPAADAHVPAAGEFAGPGQGGDRVGLDEMERGAAVHLEHRARVVGEHDDRGVEHGVVAPPALPLFVLPRTALGSELVAAHDLDADARHPLAGERLVDPVGSGRLAVDSHLAEGARLERPLHEPRAGVAEGGLQPLPLAGAEAVEGDREVVHADERHGGS